MSWTLQKRDNDGVLVAMPSDTCSFAHVATPCEVDLWLRLQAAEERAEVRREALSTVSKALGEMLA